MDEPNAAPSMPRTRLAAALAVAVALLVGGAGAAYAAGGQSGSTAGTSSGFKTPATSQSHTSHTATGTHHCP